MHQEDMLGFLKTLLFWIIQFLLRGILAYGILIICDKLDKHKYHDLRFFATLFTSNPPPRLHRRFGILGEPSPCPRRILCIANEYPRARAKRKRSLIPQASLGGGDSWTRTNDPIDVNDVLCQSGGCTFTDDEFSSDTMATVVNQYQSSSSGSTSVQLSSSQ